MNIKIKHAVEKFLLDSNMFHRTFGNDTLVYPEEWLEFESIKVEQMAAGDAQEGMLLSAKLNILLENVYKRISYFIPIQLDNMAEFHIFLDLAQVFRHHSKDSQID